MPEAVRDFEATSRELCDASVVSNLKELRGLNLGVEELQRLD